MEDAEWGETEATDEEGLDVSQASWFDDLMRRGKPIPRTLHRFPAHGAWEKAERLIDHCWSEEVDP